MTGDEHDLHLRPGRIGHGRRGAKQPKSFAGEVMRAVRKAGHAGEPFPANRKHGGRSTFGRGRRIAATLGLHAHARRVVVKVRVVRQQVARFRSAPLARHLTYLQRDGVTRDGVDARMFSASSDNADAREFAERCADDRHHFRFIVSPDDAAQLESLRGFTRDLMRQVERDLGSRLDWVAVDHWNTDNPHIHVLLRGRAEDGSDLVISRDYISRGLRGRASELVTLELGPRTEIDIQTSLRREADADRWTSLDRALRDLADEHAGLVDLRPGAGIASSETETLLRGRAAKLEKLGLAESVGPARWLLKPGMEDTLRALGTRGDVIKTMHRAMTEAGREPAVADFTLHGAEPAQRIEGRLVQRGLHDELAGTAYLIVDGIDGRSHHVVVRDLDATGDAAPGAVVMVRPFEGRDLRLRTSISVLSDLGLEQQVAAPGATWLDRRIVARWGDFSQRGFGADVSVAIERRIDWLNEQGLAVREAGRLSLSCNLLATLRERELRETATRLSTNSGLPFQPTETGDHVSGVYRQRLNLASGRFAMIDNGLGFQLVPWQPAMELKIGQQVSGTLTPSGGVDWSFTRHRGIGF